MGEIYQDRVIVSGSDAGEVRKAFGQNHPDTVVTVVKLFSPNTPPQFHLYVKRPQEVIGDYQDHQGVNFP